MKGAITHRILTALSLVGLLAVNPVRSSDGLCGRWCLKCGVNSICRACYQTSAYNGRCNKAPKFYMNCELFGTFTGECVFCTEGWSRQENGSDCPTPVKIPNCASGIIRNGVEFCQVCPNGYYPNLTGSACLPPSRVNGANPNCAWGGRALNGSIICYKCKKGWVAQYGGNSNICLHEEGNLIGCWQAEAGNNPKCIYCSGEEGYFMPSDNNICKPDDY